MNGTDGSTTFTDNSTTGHTVTVNGSAQVDTAQSKFGGASALFAGGSDYLSVADSDEHEFGTGDFTIECWIRPASFSGDDIIMRKYGSWATDVDWYFATRAGTPNIVIFRGGDSVPIALEGNTGISANTWYHVAVSRVSGTTRMFIDGVLQSETHTGSVDLSGSASALFIGGDSIEPYSGHIDDIRITKGVGRYTESFTVPSVQYPDS